MVIQQFSLDVCEQIGYYVYRLVDPRDGTTFYVGKGKGNRIFAHINCEITITKDENIETCKYKRIREIREAGLEVIHIIQRWHLTEREAFEVESALIDIFSLANLTNLVKGSNNYYGVCNAETLQRELSADIFDENEKTPKFIIIKVRQQHINELDNNRYEATRYAWKLKPSTAKKYPFVLSVTNGIVYDVYKVNSWQETENKGRYEFIGEVADKNIRDLFLKKRIPEHYRKKGSASPCLYSKNIVSSKKQNI